MQFESGPEFAASLDHDDPLAAFREQFHIPRSPRGEEEVYLTGNSLGLQPKRTAEYVREELDAWRDIALRGHFQAPHPWLPYHEFLTEPMAAVVGALPSEVVMMNSLTVNLHLMMVSFYRPTARRHRILIEEHAFPSDHYAVESQIRVRGYDPADALVVVPGHEAEIIERIAREGDSIALVLLPGVHYYTGRFFDMEAVTAAARAAGCSIGWDLAHAAGNVPVDLHHIAPDFACWCSYKYLNGGPGAIAGCFIAERHAARPDLPRFAGWWGHDKDTRFLMGPEFRPIPGAEGWQVSNPPILSMAAVRASLDVFTEAGGIDPLRQKSVRLTGYLEWLLHNECGGDVTIITPADPARRGCQLSLEVRGGREVYRRLESEGVTCDWREPNVIRVAPVPLYNRYRDIYRFVDILRKALA
jgi:kynureninase